jgi:hypothetical protein
MAVTFDAVGPSSSGVGSTSSNTLSWTHTAVGSNVIIIAGVSVDAATDTGITCSCTCGGTSMTSLGVVHSKNGTAGFLQAFWIAGQASGAHTITATTSGGNIPDDMEGGSISFLGGGQLGTVYTAAGTALNPSVSVSVSSSGNLIAGFLADGNTINSSNNTSRFIINYKGGSGDATGNAAGSTAAGTGSAVTVSWAASVSTDPYAIIAVEVQVLSVTGPPLNQGLLPNFPAAIVSNAGWRGAGHSR